MPDKNKLSKNKNNEKKSFSSVGENSSRRLYIAIAVVVSVIALAVGVFSYVHFRQRDYSSAHMAALPNMASVPGAGNPSDQYVHVQNQDNANRTVNAYKKNGSVVPTIVRSSFQGDLSAFNLSGQKKHASHAQCALPSAGPADCAVDKLKLARKGGVGAVELRCRGCQCPALRLAGYTAGDLKLAGWDAATLHACGYTLAELKAAGFSVEDLKDAGFSAQQLKKAGFNAAELKAAGFTADDLKKAGFSAADLAAAGFTAKDLKNAGFSAKQLASAGFNANDLAAAGFSDKAIHQAGLSKKSVNAQCSVAVLRKARASGSSAMEIKNRGCSAAAMHAAGFTAAELKEAGFSAKDLKAAGYSAAALKSAGFSANDLKNAGFTAGQLKSAGFSAKDLKTAGYSAAALKSAGFSAKDLNNVGFSAKDLKNAGFSAGDLNAAGFDAKALKAAGFSADRLRHAGFSAADLKKSGFSPSELKAAGYTDGDLLRAGFQPSDLGFNHSTECSVSALKKAYALHVPASALRAKGCSAYALRQAGFSAADLKAAGFTAAQLRDAGFTAKELLKAGFTPSQLRDAGFTAKDLLEAGVSLQALRKAGFTARDLHDAGLTACQTLSAGFDHHALEQAGYAPDELNQTCVGSHALGTASHCSFAMAHQAHAMGVPYASLHAQGCSNELLQEAGYLIPDASGLGQAVSGALTQSQLPAGGSSQAQRLAALRAQQEQAIQAQDLQQKIQLAQSQMAGQAQTMLADWGNVQAGAHLVTLSLPKGDVGDHLSAAGSMQAQKGPVIKAGSVFYAVLLTGINTDETSPILAKIVDGPLKGSKLIGHFSRQNDKVVLQFNTINIPSQSTTMPLTAVAIDEQTARTAISGYANYHYFLRYGSLFASSFLSGFSKAIVQNSQQMSGGFFFPVIHQDKLSTTQQVMSGLGQVGTDYAQEMGSNFTRPTTVTVGSGQGIGVLFMQDFTLGGNAGGVAGLQVKSGASMASGVGASAADTAGHSAAHLSALGASSKQVGGKVATTMTSNVAKMLGQGLVSAPAATTKPAGDLR